MYMHDILDIFNMYMCDVSIYLIFSCVIFSCPIFSYLISTNLILFYTSFHLSIFLPFYLWFFMCYKQLHGDDVKLWLMHMVHSKYCIRCLLRCQNANWDMGTPRNKAGSERSLGCACRISPYGYTNKKHSAPLQAFEMVILLILHH